MRTHAYFSWSQKFASSDVLSQIQTKTQHLHPLDGWMGKNWYLVNESSLYWQVVNLFLTPFVTCLDKFWYSWRLANIQPYSSHTPSRQKLSRLFGCSQKTRWQSTKLPSNKLNQKGVRFKVVGPDPKALQTQITLEPGTGLIYQISIVTMNALG